MGDQQGQGGLALTPGLIFALVRLLLPSSPLFLPN